VHSQDFRRCCDHVGRQGKVNLQMPNDPDESLSRNKTALDQLPPPDTKRWTARRKTAVVDAVLGGMITMEEVCRTIPHFAARSSSSPRSPAARAEPPPPPSPPRAAARWLARSNDNHDARRDRAEQQARGEHQLEEPPRQIGEECDAQRDHAEDNAPGEQQSEDHVVGNRYHPSPPRAPIGWQRQMRRGLPALWNMRQREVPHWTPGFRDSARVCG
jgi:hypothetical protein